MSLVSGFSSRMLSGLETAGRVGEVGLIFDSSRVGTPPEVWRKSCMVLIELMVVGVVGAGVCGKLGWVGLATILVKAPSSDPGRTRLIRMLTRDGGVVAMLVTVDCGGLLEVTRPNPLLNLVTSSSMRGLPTRPEKSLGELPGSLKSLMNRGWGGGWFESPGSERITSKTRFYKLPAAKSRQKNFNFFKRSNKKP